MFRGRSRETNEEKLKNDVILSLHYTRVYHTSVCAKDHALPKPCSSQGNYLLILLSHGEAIPRLYNSIKQVPSKVDFETAFLSAGIYSLSLGGKRLFLKILFSLALGQYM